MTFVSDVDMLSRRPKAEAKICFMLQRLVLLRVLRPYRMRNMTLSGKPKSMTGNEE